METFFASKRRKLDHNTEAPAATRDDENEDNDGESTDFRIAVLAPLKPSFAKPNLESTKSNSNFKSLTKKGKTLHLYSPEDIEAHTPCSIVHNFLTSSEADALLRELLGEVPGFRKETFQLFDRTVESPHTMKFYVDSSDEAAAQRTEYVYNGSYISDVTQTRPEMLKISSKVQTAVNREIERRIQDFYPNGEKLKFQSPDIWQPNASFVNCYDGAKESVGRGSRFSSSKNCATGGRFISGCSGRRKQASQRHVSLLQRLSASEVHAEMQVRHPGCATMRAKARGDERSIHVDVPLRLHARMVDRHGPLGTRVTPIYLPSKEQTAIGRQVTVCSFETVYFLLLGKAATANSLPPEPSYTPSLPHLCVHKPMHRPMVSTFSTSGRRNHALFCIFSLLSSQSIERVGGPLGGMTRIPFSGEILGEWHFEVSDFLIYQGSIADDPDRQILQLCAAPKELPQIVKDLVESDDEACLRLALAILAAKRTDALGFIIGLFADGQDVRRSTSALSESHFGWPSPVSIRHHSDCFLSIVRTVARSSCRADLLHHSSKSPSSCRFSRKSEFKCQRHHVSTHGPTLES
ncbi:hypothetical protein KC345_g150 [Hortaea werneckii]|nr:hypothetical protein KC345_g150 [Hortaea werneckii]